MSSRHNDLSWRVGGPQGSGVDTAARMFSYACAFGGLYVLGRREYYSNIMGRHSYYDVRVSAAQQPTSHRETVDMLVSFEAETLARHTTSTVAGGVVIYNVKDEDIPFERITFLDRRLREDLASYLREQELPPTTAGLLEDARRRGVQTFAFPYDEIIQALAQKLDVHKSVAQRTLNTIAVAVSVGMLEYDPECLVKALEKIFSGREKIVRLNVTAAELTYEYVREQFDFEHFAFRLSVNNQGKRMVVLNGNQASALGKLAGGLSFQTYYPISPATDESVYLEGHHTFPLRTGGTGSVVVVQTEDELSAITMAAGAALTGARSSTATSGPGFSLMVEALGWTGINEVPLVVTDYQRGSPSTGMPTRTEQGDLLFAVRAGHGEFPRIVLASGDVVETFHDAAQAFNYAERYQVPVIHLLDKNLASTTVTVPPAELEVEGIKIERGELYISTTQNGQDPFPRFQPTETGVSPRPVLGQPGTLHWYTGGEHTVYGRVTEDPVVREQQMEKRMRKLEVIAREIPVEEKFRVYGDADAPLTVMSWGSNKGAILEALELLAADGIAARLVQVRLLWPFPSDELRPYLESASPLVVAECNYSGQFARLLRECTGRACDYLIVKYNGRPMSGQALREALKQIHAGRAEHRIVLRNPYE